MCGLCSGHRASPGYNLKNNFPEVAVFWDYEKNGDLRPEDFTPFSGQFVWWLSNTGPSYKASIYQKAKGKQIEGNRKERKARTKNPKKASRIPTTTTKSPYKRKASNKYNLAREYPDLAAQWDYKKNKDLRPEHFAPFSSKKVFWKCKVNNHDHWLATIRSRALGKGCPQCAKYIASPTNNIKVCLPGLVSQWDYKKNGDLKPEDSTPFSNKEVYWLCEKGHSTKSMINNKANGLGCSKCKRQRVGKNFNITTECFELVDEWDFSKNIKLHPEMVSPRSRNKVHWKCSRCGHKHVMVVGLKCNGMKCPKCLK